MGLYPVFLRFNTIDKRNKHFINKDVIDVISKDVIGKAKKYNKQATSKSLYDFWKVICKDAIYVFYIIFLKFI